MLDIVFKLHHQLAQMHMTATDPQEENALREINEELAEIMRRLQQMSDTHNSSEQYHRLLKKVSDFQALLAKYHLFADAEGNLEIDHWEGDPITHGPADETKDNPSSKDEALAFDKGNNLTGIEFKEVEKTSKNPRYQFFGPKHLEKDSEDEELKHALAMSRISVASITTDPPTDEEEHELLQRAISLSLAQP